MLLHTFRGFSLGSQNPSRLHNLTSIPSVLSDFGSYNFLLFSVSAWPHRTPPDCMILRAFLQFLPILKPLGAFAYFSWIQPGRPEPLPDCTILPASSNFERYWNQWILVLTFLGFSLTVQNMQNLSKIGPKTHPKHRRKKRRWVAGQSC